MRVPALRTPCSPSLVFGSQHVHESLKHREVTATWYNLLRLRVPVPFCFVFRCFFLRCDLSEFTCVCPPSQGLLHWLHSDLRVHGHKASRFDVCLLFELRATFFRHLPRIPKAILALTVRCKTRLDLIQAHKQCQAKLQNKSFSDAHLQSSAQVSLGMAPWQGPNHIPDLLHMAFA